MKKIVWKISCLPITYLIMIQTFEYIFVLAQNSKTYKKTTTNQSKKISDLNFWPKQNVRICPYVTVLNLNFFHDLFAL